MKGDASYQVEWLGAKWHFANPEHKALFTQNPIKYAPQYGGHCASGMGVHGGATKDIDPEAWAIVDGKLYLNYSAETNRLLKEKVVKLEKADKNWQKLGND